MGWGNSQTLAQLAGTKQPPQQMGGPLPMTGMGGPMPSGPRMGPGSVGWDNSPQNNQKWFNGGGWQDAYKAAGIGQGGGPFMQAHRAQQAMKGQDAGAQPYGGTQPQYFAPPPGYEANSPLSAQKRAQEGLMWDSSIGKFDTLENIQARRMGGGNVPTGAAAVQARTQQPLIGYTPG